MNKITFNVIQNFEEAGLEGVYDYKLVGEDLILYSERACYLEALSRVKPEVDYDFLTLYQLEAECLRNEIYVEFIY